MASVTCTNLLTYGDFENAGWTAAANCSLSYSSAVKKYGSYSLKVTSTYGAVTESYFIQNVNPNQIQGHIYYARCEMYQETAVSSGMQAYWPQAEPSMGVVNYDTTKLKTWQIQSFRIVRSTWASGPQTFRFDVESIRSPNYVYLDGAMLIDLTADFGAGNEPTKEWCDENIPFFIGSKKLVNINMRTKINGATKEITKGYCKINGIWKEISSAHIKNTNWKVS